MVAFMSIPPKPPQKSCLYAVDYDVMNDIFGVFVGNSQEGANHLARRVRGGR